MSNAASSVNVLTERDQVMPSNSGYHCSLFANYTLEENQGGIGVQHVVSYRKTVCSVGLPW